MDYVSKALGRAKYKSYFGIMSEYHEFYRGKRVLVTGALGSIGQQIIPQLKDLEAEVIETDIYNMNVLNYPAVYRQFYGARPDIIIHLAAAKHAPAGEENPSETYRINTVGTENILMAIREVRRSMGLYRPKMILASTCKACNPETAYGASKLIAERMVLNDDGYVARFYNVVETSGNVFEIWNGMEAHEPIPYTNCQRYFVSIKEAGDFILRVPQLEPGRYTIDPGKIRWMGDVAHAIYPDRIKYEIPARRGDRIDEPRLAAQENIEDAGFPVNRIVSQHD